ncbi:MULTISPECIES: Arc family DNA-binding protein [unclassified Rhizobium]|uniref:FitA-like ribbon-helix-helix domain-containing protein n=1 Tax=unclassified Rhizobium TaxID=2613769 RepID=UPI000EA90684|nr:MULTISPECIES: Arc family DNA-binding protein [unclassified Rhizobium]AYG66715.1 Arc family DNA-binding protein [Rhizobium sp. CCGE531]AYG73095.1 Arc family DNA-binding protein [Rhizobium sp. CCGE532]
MAAITVRNLPDETHRALKLRAEQHGRSTEAEIREILEEAVRPKDRLKIGSELAAFGRQFGGLDLDLERERTPTEPASFE